VSKRIAYNVGGNEQVKYHTETISLMRNLKSNPNPINYRLVYEAVVGDNPILTNTIYAMAQSNDQLTDIAAIRLSQKFLTSHENDEEHNYINFHIQVIDAFEYLLEKLNEQQELIKDLTKHPDDLRFYISRLTRSNNILLKKAKSTKTDMVALRAKMVGSKEAIYTDLLTQLKNELHMKHVLPEILKRTSTNKILVALYDIDHFDLFNITHGHYLGDSLLRSCAKLFDESLTGDHKGFAWRSGPDEFISIIISDDVDIQLSVFEELHSKLNRLQFTDKGIDDIHCSMSVIESSSDFEETVNRLYRALDVIKNTAGKAIHVNR
jgi:diguanylate cyclase (GGDEF)-like protein